MIFSLFTFKVVYSLGWYFYFLLRQLWIIFLTILFRSSFYYICDTDTTRLYCMRTDMPFISLIGPFTYKVVP